MSTGLKSLVRRWRDRLSRPVTMERVSRFIRSRWNRMLHLDTAATSAPQPHFTATGAPGYSTDYASWIRHRIDDRRALYTARPDETLFTIVTPVYNTPPRFLNELAESVFAQDFPFQWAISDDGSTNPETLAIVDRLARDPRVVCRKLPKNVGISGATRAAFELATGRYLIPVDADDLIYPDALRVMASCLEQAGWPALAYSDEDKVFGDSRPIHPFFKPDWDPVLFSNCCYIAHLCAIDRETAHRVNVYSDYEARGCPDLDTFVRVLATGAKPLHIPEVLYSWRIHAGSTSSAENRAKPYTIDCQKHVWTRHLANQEADDRFELRTNPLFGNVGMWYPARRRTASACPVHVNLVCESGSADAEQVLAGLLGDRPDPALSLTLTGLPGPELQHLAAAAAARLGTDRVSLDPLSAGYTAFLRKQSLRLSPDTIVVTACDSLRVQNEGWTWDLRALIDLHADAVLTTPRVFDATGLLASAGEHFGFDGIAGPPDVGRAPHDSGYHGWVYCQRTVGVPHADLFAARASFLADSLPRIPDVPRKLLALWLAGVARRDKLRTVYTPFWTARQLHARGVAVGPEPHADDWIDFLREFQPLLAADPCYSRFLQLEKGRGFDLATPGQRAAVLNRSLCRLEGPLAWYGRMEQPANRYPEPDIADQLARAVTTPLTLPAPRLRAA